MIASKSLHLGGALYYKVLRLMDEPKPPHIAYTHTYLSKQIWLSKSLELTQSVIHQSLDIKVEHLFLVIEENIKEKTNKKHAKMHYYTNV